MRLHRTDRRKLVTIFIIQLYRQKYLFRVLDRVDVCTEGIVLQQSNLVDSTVTLHLHLVFRNKRWNSLQVEQEAERTKKMLARFLKNCESIVSQGVVSFMMHVCIENQSQGSSTCRSCQLYKTIESDTLRVQKLSPYRN